MNGEKVAALGGGKGGCEWCQKLAVFGNANGNGYSGRGCQTAMCGGGWCGPVAPVPHSAPVTLPLKNGRRTVAAPPATAEMIPPGDGDDDDDAVIGSPP